MSYLLQDLPLALVGIFDDNNAALKLVVDFADFYRLCKSTEFPEAKLASMDKYEMQISFASDGLIIWPNQAAGHARRDLSVVRGLLGQYVVLSEVPSSLSRAARHSPARVLGNYGHRR